MSLGQFDLNVGMSGKTNFAVKHKNVQNHPIQVSDFCVPLGQM